MVRSCVPPWFVPELSTDLQSVDDPSITCSDASPSQPIGLTDLTSFDGFAYPHQAPTIVWPGGRFKTVLPFLPRTQNPIATFSKMYCSILFLFFFTEHAHRMHFMLD